MTAATRLAIIVSVLATGMAGWVFGGYPGAAVGLAVGVAVGVIRWRSQPVWSWLILWRRRGRAIV
ncbi:MAG: type VII secretion protein EccE, partial [Mycobacterium sp.]